MATREVRPRRTGGTTIDPLYLLFLLYFLANFYALTTLFLDLPITVENEEFTFPQGTLLWAALAVFGSLFACVVAFRSAEKMTKPAADMVIGRTGALVLLIMQIAFVAYNQYYNVNVAGVEDEAQGNFVLRLLFSVAQPDLLFLLIGVGIASPRLFVINALVYCASLLLRTWIGGLYLVAVVVAIRAFPIRIDRRTFKLLGVLLIVGALSLPLIVSGKWFIRSGANVGAALDFLSEVGYSTYLLDSLGYVANRFQHIGHVALILQNSEALNGAYDAGSFIPYWMDGAPQWLLMRLSGIDIVTLNKYMVQSLFGSSNMAYATNPGLAGWLFVLQYQAVFFVLFFMAITFIPALLIRQYAGQKYFLLVACFCLIYLFHGWIGAYVNLVLYSLALILVKRLARRPWRSAWAVARATTLEALLAMPALKS